MSYSMIAAYVSMANSIGIVMHNAGTNQRNGQTIATGAMAVSCTLILSKAS